MRVVVPYAPGGSTDTVARSTADRLSRIWGQQVVIENKPGAGTNIGAAAVAISDPDGYTMFIGSSSLATSRLLYRSLPYAISDLAPVTLVCAFPLLILAPNSSPAKSVGEFIAFARENKGKVTFASPGVGTVPHLAGELLKQQSGIEMTHVPYRGIGAAYPDVMSGKVQLAFSSIAGAVPFTADNRVRPIATTGSARSPVYPDVPTVAESGLPGFDVDLWIGIYAPAGLPPAVRAKLNGEINKVLQHPELKSAFAKIGIAPRGTTPEQAAAFTRSEYEKWKQVIVDGKIKPE